MKVYTFYTRLRIGGPLGPLKTLVNERRHRALIAVWKRSWAAQGWQPCVLGERDAFAANPDLSRQLSNARNLYRSPNPKAYERACYLRWVAMTTRGGLMTDYDVMNRTLTPTNWENLRANFDSTLPLSLGGMVPCCVGATPEAFENMVQLFLEFEEQPFESPHLQIGVSDQNIFASSPSRFCEPSPPLCAHYPNEAWQSAPVVHFPHGALRTNRAQTIARLLAQSLSGAPATS